MNTAQLDVHIDDRPRLVPTEWKSSNKNEGKTDVLVAGKESREQTVPVVAAGAAWVDATGTTARVERDFVERCDLPAVCPTGA